MTVQYGEIDGIMLLAEPLVNDGTDLRYAASLLNFEMPDYNESTDSGSLGGGGEDRGAATTLTLAQIIQNQRRDGLTVTLLGAILVQPGLEGSTYFYTGAFTVSAGNLTFSLTEADNSTGLSAAAGVHDQPLGIIVVYSLSEP